MTYNGTAIKRKVAIGDFAAIILGNASENMMMNIATERVASGKIKCSLKP